MATQARLLRWLDLPLSLRSVSTTETAFPAPPMRHGATERDGRDLRRILRLLPDTPVVSMAAIAERLGIPVVRMRLDEDVAGAALSIGGERGIVINQAGLNEKPGVGRFTTGHEIAHAILETDLHLNRLSVTNRGVPGRTSRRRGDRIECRAQAFAGELLLPAHAAGRFFLEAGGHREALMRMTAVYDVSFTTARRQAATGVRDAGDGGDVEAEKPVLDLPKEDAPDAGSDWELAEAPASRSTMDLETWADGTFSQLVVAAYGSNVISADTSAGLLEVPRTDFEAARAPPGAHPARILRLAPFGGRSTARAACESSESVSTHTPAAS